MSGVDVQPADIVEATVNACKRTAFPRAKLIHPREWDLDYMQILEDAQAIADRRVRDTPS